MEALKGKMAALRHGNPIGLFDGTTAYNQLTNPVGGVGVPTGATSALVHVGRGADNFSFYVSVPTAIATTWLLQVAHSGSIDAQGVMPDEDELNYIFHDCWYLGTSGAGNSTKVEVSVGATGGSVMALVPDFTPGWVRLKRTDLNGAVTVTAGWETQGD